MGYKVIRGTDPKLTQNRPTHERGQEIVSEIQSIFPLSVTFE